MRKLLAILLGLVLMATVTHGIATASSANTTSYASGSFTPVADDLLVVFVVKSGSVNNGTMSDSLGGAWTRITGALLDTSSDMVEAFVRNSRVTATAMTVTYDCTGDAATGCIVFVARVSGMPNLGSAAIRQNATQANQVSGGTPAPAFASACKNGNPTLGVVGNGTNPATLIPPTNWTEQSDTGYTVPATGGEYISRDNGFTGTTITWGGTSASAFGDIILELDASTLSATESLGIPASESVIETTALAISETLAPVLADATDIRASLNSAETIGVLASDAATDAVLALVDLDSLRPSLSELVDSLSARLSPAETLGVGVAETVASRAALDSAEADPVGLPDATALLARIDPAGESAVIGLTETTAAAFLSAATDALAAVAVDQVVIQAALVDTEGMSAGLSDALGAFLARLDGSEGLPLSVTDALGEFTARLSDTEAARLAVGENIGLLALVTDGETVPITLTLEATTILSSLSAIESWRIVYQGTGEGVPTEAGPAGGVRYYCYISWPRQYESAGGPP